MASKLASLVAPSALVALMGSVASCGPASVGAQSRSRAPASPAAPASVVMRASPARPEQLSPLLEVARAARSGVWCGLLRSGELVIAREWVGGDAPPRLEEAWRSEPHVRDFACQSSAVTILYDDGRVVVRTVEGRAPFALLRDPALRSLADVKDYAQCGVRADGSVMCAASYDRIGDWLPAQLARAGRIRSLVDGSFCAIAADGRLWCRGYVGQSIDLAPVLDRVVRASISEDGTVPPPGCAVRTDASVWCWGTNATGYAGDGTRAARATPVRVAGLPPARDVAFSGSHACAIATDGGVWCWGHNSGGEVGPDAASVTERLPVCAVDDAATARARAAFARTASCPNPSGDDPCGRMRWNQERAGIGPPTVYRRDGVCVEPGAELPAVLHPVRVTDMHDAVLLWLGRGLSCAARIDGALACWGPWQHVPRLHIQPFPGARP